MSQAQESFIDQMTRKLLVDWCLWATIHNVEYVLASEVPAIFRDYALTKKWLGALNPTGGHKILAAGWEVAARFLKR